MRHQVGIAEMRVSDDEKEIITAKRLASCVAITLYDESAKVGGLLRCVLPSSAIDGNRASNAPHTFADTGIQKLLESVEQLGADRGKLRATLVGGSNLLGDSTVFHMGDRTTLSVRDALSILGIQVQHEEVGGVISRDMEFRLADGRVVVFASGVEKELV